MARDPMKTKIVRDAAELAAAEGLDLFAMSARQFAPLLDNWVLEKRLPLPPGHPLRHGTFSYGSDMAPADILLMADDQYREEQQNEDAAPETDNETDPSDTVTIDGEIYVREQNDEPTGRDTPTEEIFGKEREEPSCRKIVVVPGILGSEIIELTPRPGLSDAWRKIWPPISADSGSVAPLDHLVDINSDQNIPGAPTREVKILEPAYDGLLGRLRADGYTEQNGRLHPWGYDWTKSNRVSGERLKDYINQIAGVSSSKPEGDCAVDVICHSMGGLVTRAAIKLGAVVRRSVYLASPHHGSPKAYFTLHPLVPTPLASSWWQRLLINKLWDAYAQEVQPREGDLGELLASFARQFPSAYELLPDDFYFQTNKFMVTLWYWTSAQNLMGLKTTYYTSPDVGFPRTGGMRSKVRQAMRFKNWLGRLPPGEHLSIYSKTEKTMDHIVFSYRSTNAFRTPTDSGQAGDGTVPTTSANVGAKVLFNAGAHVGIPNRQDTYDKIAAYLNLRGGA